MKGDMNEDGTSNKQSKSLKKPCAAGAMEAGKEPSDKWYLRQKDAG